MAEISLCMIVRDEEAVLARCLDSVRDAVDEIIIVDTGSRDTTKQIAARYTDKVFDFAWRDDFSAARNFSFSKATRELIMWLDADDVMLEEDRVGLIALKNGLSDDVDVVMLKYNTAFDETGRAVFFFYRERLVRRAAGPVWHGRVHEVIFCPGKAVRSEVAVCHRSVKTGYGDRNLRIYEKQLSEGEPLSPRDSFYYGRELYYHGHSDEAERVFTGFLESGEGWVEDNIEACKYLSRCRLEAGDEAGALDALCFSFRYCAPRTDICCELGDIFLGRGDYPTAVFWFELALHLGKSERNDGFISEDCRGYLPCIRLCVCYDRLGDYARAEEYNSRAGAYRPASPDYLYNLEYFRGRNSQERRGIY